jgi:hypothetical protein
MGLVRFITDQVIAEPICQDFSKTSFSVTPGGNEIFLQSHESSFHV